MTSLSGLTSDYSPLPWCFSHTHLCTLWTLTPAPQPLHVYALCLKHFTKIISYLAASNIPVSVQMSSPQTGMPWSPYSNVIHRQPLSDSLLIILHLISLYHCLKLSSLFCFVFYCLWSLPCYIHMQTHTRKYKLHDKGTESVLVTALSPKSRTMPGI